MTSLAILRGWARRVMQVGRARTYTLETRVDEDYEALNAAQTASETFSFTAYRYAQFARHLGSAMRILDVGCNTGRGGGWCCGRPTHQRTSRDSKCWRRAPPSSLQVSTTR